MNKMSRVGTAKNKMIRAMYNLVVPMFMAVILMVFIQLIEKSFLYTKMDNIIILLLVVSVALVSMSVSIIFLNDITKEKRNRVKEIDIDSKKLDEILSEKVLLKKAIRTNRKVKW